MPRLALRHARRPPPLLSKTTAGAKPRFDPARRPLPSEVIRERRLRAALQALSASYLAFFAVFLMPIFPFGAWRLTLYEHTHRLDSLLAGEVEPRALKAARKTYRSRPAGQWSPLANLPPGARLSFPSTATGGPARGIVETRYEFFEPVNMRQFRLYILEPKPGEMADCLLLWPSRPGDWKRVRARAGKAHPPFNPSESAFDWPPARELGLRTDQGWPALFDLRRCSWPRERLDPLMTEMKAKSWRLGDPPGRERAEKAAAFWSYKAKRNQRRPPLRPFVDLFLIVDEAILIETKPIRPGTVEYDLKTPAGTLEPIYPFVA